MRPRAGSGRRTGCSRAAAILRNGTTRRFAVIAAHRTLGPGRFLRRSGATALTLAVPVTAATAAVALRARTQLARTRPWATAARSLATFALARLGAIPGIMTSSSTLVAAVIGVESSAATLSAAGRTTTSTATTAAAETATTLPGGQFHSDTATAHRATVKATDRVLCVPGVVELHESESRRIPSYPNIPQRTIVGESIFDFLLTGVVAELANINLGVVGIARHFL